MSMENENRKKAERENMMQRHPVQQAYSNNPTTDKEVSDAVIQLNPDRNSMHDSRG